VGIEQHVVRTALAPGDARDELVTIRRTPARIADVAVDLDPRGTVGVGRHQVEDLASVFGMPREAATSGSGIPRR
jgi:hypothetical protein